MPPNGLPFSRRKRTAKRVKKRMISRAQRSAGTAGWAGWPPTLVCRSGMTAPHQHAITPAQRAFGGITRSIRSRWARRARRTTGHRTTPAERARCTTGVRIRKGTRDPIAPAAQRIGIQLPRARPNGPSKYERSRARSGQLQCRVGPCGFICVDVACNGLFSRSGVGT